MQRGWGGAKGPRTGARTGANGHGQALQAQMKRCATRAAFQMHQNPYGGLSGTLVACSCGALNALSIPATAVCQRCSPKWRELMPHVPG